MNLELYVNYITDLISSFINKKEIKPIPKNFNLNFFLQFCKFHKIENIVYLALKDTDIPVELKQELKKLYMHSISVMAKQQYYLEKVEKAFDKAGIDYFVMKGRELSKLYPSEDIRQSSDFDIYVGNEKAEQARDIMVSLGFNALDYNEDDGHDQYLIDKIILCEIHRVLIQDDVTWKDECNKIPERVIKCDESRHCYQMNIEDFYFFNIAHAAKHIKTSGIGIRIYIDLWLIYKKYKDEFDYTVLNERLKSANLTKFEECSRKLFLYWFEGKETSDETIKAMARFISQSGWIGTYRQYNSTKLALSANQSNSSVLVKFKNYWNIIFPSYKELIRRYPNAEKHKILVPFYYIYRIFKSLFGKDKGAKRVISEMSASDLEKGKNLLKLKKDIGL